MQQFEVGNAFSHSLGAFWRPLLIFRRVQGAFTSSDWVLHHLRAKNWLAVTFFPLVCIAEKFQGCVGIVGCAVNTIMPTACWAPISQNHSSSDKLQYLQTSCKTSQKVAGFADKNFFQGV